MKRTLLFPPKIKLHDLEMQLSVLTIYAATHCRKEDCLFSTYEEKRGENMTNDKLTKNYACLLHVNGQKEENERFI